MNIVENGDEQYRKTMNSSKITMNSVNITMNSAENNDEQCRNDDEQCQNEGKKLIKIEYLICNLGSDTKLCETREGKPF